MNVTQRTTGWAQAHTADEIDAAHERGEFNALLGRPVPVDDTPAGPGEASIQQDQEWIPRTTVAS